MDLERLDALETIDPTPLAPWSPPAFEEIRIDSDRDRASDNAAALVAVPNAVVYSDASASQDHLGAAAVILDHNEKVADFRQVSIGSKTHWSIHAAELIGIYYAIELITMRKPSNQHSTLPHHPKVTIVCDSQSALKTLANPSNKAGQTYCPKDEVWVSASRCFCISSHRLTTYFISKVQ